MKIVNILFFFFLAMALQTSVPAFAAEVKNKIVRQENKRVTITYDLEGSEAEAQVTVTVKAGGTVYAGGELHMKGDVGKVKVGKGRKIWWNVRQDFPRGLHGDVEVTITTGGGTLRDLVSGMEFVFVKGGCFQMGDTFGDGGSEEKPVHEVCVDDFNLGKFDVTVGEFAKFVDATGYRTDAEKGGGCWTYLTYEVTEFKKGPSANWRSPGFKQDENHPVVCVSWNDAQEFIKWLNVKSRRNYRLPTEAEWEYAARSGGKKYKYAWGYGEPSGNIADESGKQIFPTWSIWNGYDDGYVFTSPVGSFKPNELGLYDMAGNVWQWCSDWFGKNYYGSSPRNNPDGPSSGIYRVRRGGSCFHGPQGVRAAYRDGDIPGDRQSNYGFRVLAPAK